VPKADIAKDGAYDLSLNRYKEVEHEEVHHEAPADIIREQKQLEAEIAEGLAKLEERDDYPVRQSHHCR
jgi:type I restriction enzyme M protein